MSFSRIRGRRLQRRREAFKDIDPICAHCRRKPWTVLDHITALVNGGEDTDENLQGLCDDCHETKTAEDMGYKPRHGCDADGNPLSPAHHWREGALNAGG